MSRASLCGLLFAPLLCIGFAQAEVPQSLLGRWIVVRLGGHLAYLPYKLRLYPDLSTFPDDGKYGIARLTLEAFGRESCFLVIDGANIVGPAEFQKRNPEVPYMLCTKIEGGPAWEECAKESDERECVQHVIDDGAYLDKLFDAKALKWRKARDRLTIFSIDGDGTEIVLAPDPAWPR